MESHLDAFCRLYFELNYNLYAVQLIVWQYVWETVEGSDRLLDSGSLWEREYPRIDPAMRTSAKDTLGRRYKGLQGIGRADWRKLSGEQHAELMKLAEEDRREILRTTGRELGCTLDDVRQFIVYLGMDISFGNGKTTSWREELIKDLPKNIKDNKKNLLDDVFNMWKIDAWERHNGSLVVVETGTVGRLVRDFYNEWRIRRADKNCWSLEAIDRLLYDALLRDKLKSLVSQL